MVNGIYTEWKNVVIEKFELYIFKQKILQKITCHVYEISILPLYALWHTTGTPAYPESNKICDSRYTIRTVDVFVNFYKIDCFFFEKWLTFPDFSHLMSGGGVPWILHSNVAESPSQQRISQSSTSIFGIIFTSL